MKKGYYLSPPPGKSNIHVPVRRSAEVSYTTPWSPRVQAPRAWNLTRVMPTAGQADPSAGGTIYLPLLSKTFGVLGNFALICLFALTSVLTY